MKPFDSKTMLEKKKRSFFFALLAIFIICETFLIQVGYIYQRLEGPRQDKYHTNIFEATDQREDWKDKSPEAVVLVSNQSSTLS